MSLSIAVNTLTSIFSLESLHGFKTNIQNLFDGETQSVIIVLDEQKGTI